MPFLDQWVKQEVVKVLADLSKISELSDLSKIPAEVAEAAEAKEVKNVTTKGVNMGFSFGGFLSITDKILSISATAFNAVETEVGAGVAPVEAVVGVAVTIAKADPTLNPWITAGLAIESEVASIIGALRSIHAKAAVIPASSVPASSGAVNTAVAK